MSLNIQHMTHTHTNNNTLHMLYGELRRSGTQILNRHDRSFERYHFTKKLQGFGDYDLIVYTEGSHIDDMMIRYVYAVKPIDVGGYPTIDDESPCVLVTTETWKT